MKEYDSNIEANIGTVAESKMKLTESRLKSKMKLTKSRLKEIIEEELNNVLKESMKGRTGSFKIKGPHPIRPAGQKLRRTLSSEEKEIVSMLSTGDLSFTDKRILTKYVATYGVERGLEKFKQDLTNDKLINFP